MRITILSLFPEMLEASLEYSIIKKAIDKNILSVRYVNIRHYTKDKHKKADDYPYGGGPGMLLKPEPLSEAIEDNIEKETKVIYMSPRGKLLNQNIVKELAKEKKMLIISGHYEGIDQRVIDKYVHESISIGDYILTGGELPALVLIDSMTRLLDEVLGNKDSHLKETFEDGVLEYPQYTRPFDYKNNKVPEVLLSGDHGKIKRWKRYKSIEITLKNRPDLIENKNEIIEEFNKLKEEFK